MQVAAVFFLILLSGCAHRYWTPSYPITRKVLDNGLTVIYVEDHSVPVVSYSTMFKVGSAWEVKGKTGLAHLLEHLMFKGTPRFGPKQFFKTLESKGALVNAYTQRDATVYYSVISSKYLELVIDMESDRLKNLGFTPADLEAERKIVKEERRVRIESNFSAQQMEELELLAFPNHPYGWPVIGFEEGLNQLSVQDVQQFFKNYYQPGNAIIVISGDFDPDQAHKWIEKYYGSIEGHDVPDLDLEDQKISGPEKRKEIEKPVETESLLVGYYIPSIYNKDSEALSMLAWALFGMSSSRAHVQLVRTKNMALSVRGDAQQEQFPSLFTILVEMKRGISAAVAEEELDKLIEDAKRAPLSNAELERVKNWIIYNTVNEAKSPAGVANWLASGELYWDDYKYVFKLLDRYHSMTPEDLNRVAKLYLKKENRVVVVMKPQKKAYARSSH